MVSKQASYTVSAIDNAMQNSPAHTQELSSAWFQKIKVYSLMQGPEPCSEPSWYSLQYKDRYTCSSVVSCSESCLRPGLSSWKHYCDMLVSAWAKYAAVSVHKSILIRTSVSDVDERCRHTVGKRSHVCHMEEAILLGRTWLHTTDTQPIP